MNQYYLDTSAAIKLYVVEPGTTWLRQLLLIPNGEVVSSQLLQIELWSGFMRRLRDGSVSTTDYNQMLQWFLTHQQTLYQLSAMQPAHIQVACDLIERHPLRAGDAIHLATAIITNQYLAQRGEPALIFLSADNRLNLAAQAEGLAVDNPNQHP